ncbi:hypothetical protein OUZ56_009108 [Daphnia magna]|uniref:Uncharacterized protein n=1 Tax=Daphnia magna TaxID=35525 RepID=A0ABR0AF77_9CRUS|nr:hypothetical protein OUZ56_009108 [Daphnia magna]
MTGWAPFDALAHADSGSMNFSASNGTTNSPTPKSAWLVYPLASNPHGIFSIKIFFRSRMITKPESLNAARRARSDGECPSVIGYTVRPQTIFKARKMMMGLYLPILGIRRQKRSRVRN